LQEDRCRAAARGTFLELDHYEASLGQAQIQAVILPRGKFRARLTWAELDYLQVLRCEEDSPRIAYVQLAPDLTFVTFLTDSGPLPVLRGTENESHRVRAVASVEKIRRVLRDGNPNMMNVAEVARSSALRVGALRRDLPG